MDKTTAANVAHDLIAAGYQAHATSPDNGATWQVLATSAADGSMVPTATVQSFAQSHGVIGEVTTAVFV